MVPPFSWLQPPRRHFHRLCGLFRCQSCQECSPVGELAHRVVVETQRVSHPRRPKAHVFRQGGKDVTRDDSGGSGTQVVREHTVCAACAAANREPDATGLCSVARGPPQPARPPGRGPGTFEIGMPSWDVPGTFRGSRPRDFSPDTGRTDVPGTFRPTSPGHLSEGN